MFEPLDQPSDMMSGVYGNDIYESYYQACEKAGELSEEFNGQWYKYSVEPMKMVPYKKT